jgi:hypothetical protein
MTRLRRWADERGQTFTEVVMISGFITMAAVSSAAAGHRVVCVEQRGGHAVVSRLG